MIGICSRRRAGSRRARIAEGTRAIELAYGPDRARFKRIDENETGLTMTRTIAGGSYEVAITAAGTVTAKVYVGGAAGGESTCRRTLEPTASP